MFQKMFMNNGDWEKIIMSYRETNKFIKFASVMYHKTCITKLCFFFNKNMEPPNSIFLKLFEKLYFFLIINLYMGFVRWKSWKQ